MRRFENSDFHIDHAEALTETYRLETPNSLSQDALDYIQPFIMISGNTAELLFGYISEELADGLVSLREANSDYDLNAAVSEICVNGETSNKVTDYSEFTEVTFPTTFSTEKKLSETRKEVSEEARRIIDTMREICTNSRSETETIIVPQSISDEILHNTNL